jgi:hypothetical protein
MKKKGLLCFLGFAMLMLLKTGALAEVQPVPLSEEDCSKCHEDAVKDLNEHGGLHGDISCLDCHEEHPPLGKNTVAECGLCHDSAESEHYAVQNCKACHPPHRPKEMDFSKIDLVKPACLSCHPEPGKQMETHPSAHAEFDCKECHSEHRKATACLDCHDAHAEDMTDKNCQNCHKPHGPKEVTYGDDIPSRFCSCCHEEIGKALSQSKMAHRELSCVECHQSEHTAISQCDACHDEKPHGTYMHEKYPNCLDCHKDAHALAE